MGSFNGTGTLLRLALRLDRVRLTVWVLLLAVMPAATSMSSVGLGVTALPPEPTVKVAGRRMMLMRSPSSAASPTSEVCERTRPRKSTALSSARARSRVSDSLPRLSQTK